MMSVLNLPLHPMLVHFPIAFFVGAFVLQTIGVLFQKEILKQTAWHCFLFAIIAVPFVVWSGLEEARMWKLTTHPVFLLHKNFALTTLFLSLVVFPVLCVIRNKAARLFPMIFLLCLLAIVGCVALTAHNGGRLVYEYGIGSTDKP